MNKFKRSLQEARDQVDQMGDAAVGYQAVAVAPVFAFGVRQRDGHFLLYTCLQVNNVSPDGVQDRLPGARVPLNETDMSEWFQQNKYEFTLKVVPLLRK